ncbi:transposase [Paracoccus aminovorans]|uniref:transposase n=1 Tax=Paracoccus aminovorans TaxID=34004 RepID=UPI0018D4FC63|nr:transposase [Paracoccus aminovorans]
MTPPRQPSRPITDPKLSSPCQTRTRRPLGFLLDLGQLCGEFLAVNVAAFELTGKISHFIGRAPKRCRIVRNLERRIESIIAQEEASAVKARLLLSIPGIGPVSAAMLIAELPELGRMTSGEAAAMTGLAPIPHDSGIRRGKRAIAGAGAH